MIGAALPGLARPFSCFVAWIEDQASFLRGLRFGGRMVGLLGAMISKIEVSCYGLFP